MRNFQRLDAEGAIRQSRSFAATESVRAGGNFLAVVQVPCRKEVAAGPRGEAIDAKLPKGPAIQLDELGAAEPPPPLPLLFLPLPFIRGRRAFSTMFARGRVEQ